MFKLPDGIPSLRTSAQDWADYAEYHALNAQGSSISLLNLMKAPKMVSDEIEVNGIEDDSDRFTDKIDEISAEIRERGVICGRKYPFKLVNQDYCLIYSPEDGHTNLIYRYLLMCTRVKMSKNRIFSDIDGALLFEHLCAEVALNFFGERAEVEVFGTSKLNSGGFRSNLENLVARMREGGKIHTNEGHKPKDEKVDIVVWKGFSDRKASQMIAFGQCKTGTSWTDKLSELNTDSFCKTWFTFQPVLTPVRMFFCAQYFPNDIWRVRANTAGLVFDRFRIMDYLPEKIDVDLVGKIEKWTSTAFQSYNQ